MIKYTRLSVVIPCRNEEAYIGRCLESIVKNDYPPDRLEVLVVDGLSTDKTVQVASRYAREFGFIKIIENPEKTTPAALNRGIRNALGECIIILSAHSVVGAGFLRGNAEGILNYDADCVGGVLRTLPASDRPVARSIAIALSNPFGMGNAHFRIGSDGPKAVDTVPFGCYRRTVFEKIGLFDLELVRNQDDEFNMRLAGKGGKIMLLPWITSSYYARDSLGRLWKMFYQYGYYKPLVAKKAGGVLTWRQLVPPLFVGSLAVSLALSPASRGFLLLAGCILMAYILVSLLFSVLACLKGNLKALPALPLAFGAIHFSYGLGYLKGLFDFMLVKKRAAKDLPITR